MPSRRSVVAALGAGFAALAGCNASSDTTTTSTSTPTTTATTSTSTTSSTTANDDVRACDASWDPTPTWTVEAPSVGYPHLASGRVYTVVAGELRALAADDGAVQWRESVTDGSVYTVGGGVVLAADDGVTVFDAASGERLWSFTPPGDTGAKWEAVAVHDDTAYVVAAQVQTPSTDPDIVYGRLYRFDLRSGDRLGVHDITREDEDWLEPGAVLADDTGVYVTRDAGGVLGLDHDGTVRWRREGDDWYYDPVRAGDVLVQPQSRGATALALETGETVWTDGRLDMQITAADGVLYGTSGGSPETYATFAAVDAATGDARWTSKLDGCSSSIVAGGGVVATGVSCRQSRLDLYDATTGCRYGGVDGGSAVQPGLAVGDDTFYVTRFGDTDELTALPVP